MLLSLWHSEQVLELRDEEQYAEVRFAGIYFGALCHRLVSSITPYEDVQVAVPEARV